MLCNSLEFGTKIPIKPKMSKKLRITCKCARISSHINSRTSYHFVSCQHCLIAHLPFHSFSPSNLQNNHLSMGNSLANVNFTVYQTRKLTLVRILFFHRT